MALRFPIHSRGIDSLIKIFSDFLNDSIYYSNQNTPPGRNASNGFFWAKMIAPFPENGEPYLKRNFNLDESLLDEETKLLYTIMKQFINDFILGFQKNTPAPGRDFFGCLDLILDEAKAAIPDFVQFLFDDPNASERLKERAQALLNTYNTACVHNGHHMNGVIAGSSQKAALDAIELLGKNGFVGDLTQNGAPVRDDITEAKIVANIFGVTCSSIARLQTANHKPWLTAQWQLGLTMVFESSSNALGSQQARFFLARENDVPENMKPYIDKLRTIHMSS